MSANTAVDHYEILGVPEHADTQAIEVAYRAGLAKIKASLGGGNHFIEIQAGDDGRVWLMLHSGSRGTGNIIGTYFIQEAREALEKRVRELETENAALQEQLEALKKDGLRTGARSVRR